MSSEISMSKGQSNGITGEMLLPLHLKEKFNCIADKCDHDFGFDFDVHVFDGAGITTGSFFKAQCKEVESGKYKYAKLEEKHMRLYLKTREVVCIFGVDLENKCIRHRFFDKDLAQKFCDALQKNQKQICLNFETELRSEIEFMDDLIKHSDQCSQNQLYEYISEKRLQEKIPNVKINVINNSQGTDLKITTPYITDVVNPLLLTNGLTNNNVEDVICADCLGEIKKRYRNFRMVQFGGVAAPSSQTEISVNNVSVKVSIWPRRGNVAYMMSSGLSLEFGPCQQGEDKCHYHPCIFEIEKSAKPFFDNDDDVIFFENLDSDKALYFDKAPMIPKISEWELLNVHFKVIQEIICLRKELPSLFENFYLSYLKDEKYWNNVQVLYQLLVRKNEQYILETSFLDHDVQKNTYHNEIEGVFPMIFTLDDVYRFNFSCSYSLVENEGQIVGVAIGKIKKIEFEKSQDEEKCSYPNVDFSRVEPPIPWKK